MEKEDREITITGDDGSEEKVELITEIESVEGYHYIVYTKNEMDDNEDVIVYSSKVIEKDGEPTLVDLTDKEWEEIQEFLNEEGEEE